MLERYEVIESIIKNNLKKNTGAEIGVWKGETTDYLLTKFPQLHLYCVDPYIAYDHYKKYHHCGKYEDQKKFDQLYEKTREIIYKKHGERGEFLRYPSVVASECIEDKSLDFVFIDANHGYKFVCQDIEAWLPKVRNGGYYIGHDIHSNKDSHESVKRAVELFFGKEYKIKDECWYVHNIS